MKKDRLLLLKIQDYIKRVKRINELIKDMNENEILELDESFALTQYIINIHSLFDKISSDEIARNQIEIGIRSINVCRNISAHDYDALDWNRVKQICKKLTSEKTDELLKECIKIAEREESEMKDYTN
jgi:uncharacterized protein YutE (UPF0331/DUF86 family)